MIPEAAVEAALDALGVRGPVTRWVVDAVLEAAAPHIRAQALEGAAVGDEPNFGCPDCGDLGWACDCRWRNGE